MNAARPLTRAESTDLQKVARMRAKIARSQIAAQEAALRARLEEDLSAMYPSNDPRWKHIKDEAERAVAEADAKIAAICREQGIPEEFRPGMGANWYSRGQNATASRRAELRRLGEAKIAEAGKTAKAAIDRKEVDVITAIVADGLTSESAREFLASIPSPETLMGTVEVASLEKVRVIEASRANEQRSARLISIVGDDS